jgi:hypothetical protein
MSKPSRRPNREEIKAQIKYKKNNKYHFGKLR